MGINIGSGSSGSSFGDGEVISDINTTPLIDVMLVLLIMLIITIPIQLHAVNLNLPTGNPPPPPDKPPEVVRIDVDGEGRVYWNGEVTASAALENKLQELAALPEQPEVHLRPNKAVEYDAVARVLAAAQRVGVTKLGVTGNEQFLP